MEDFIFVIYYPPVRAYARTAPLTRGAETRSVQHRRGWTFAYGEVRRAWALVGRLDRQRGGAHLKYGFRRISQASTDTSGYAAKSRRNSARSPTFVTSNEKS